MNGIVYTFDIFDTLITRLNKRLIKIDKDNKYKVEILYYNAWADVHL